MRARLLVPLLLCFGMLVIPLLALDNAGPRAPGGRVRVAADASGLAAASPPGPTPVIDAALAISGGDTTTVAPVAPVPPSSSAAPARRTVSRTTSTPAPKAVHIASEQRTFTTNAPVPQHTESGPASWYGAPAGTCAHQSLPFGTVLHIVDVDNGRTATCTVEDRGPYLDGRIVDLAPDVFSQMAPTSTGVINVEISWQG